MFQLIVWLWRKRFAGGVVFARALRKADREAFDELMDMCRNYASESSNATNPIVFEPMVMSVLLGQQRRIRELEQKLKAMQPDLAYASTIQEPKEIDLAEPKITIPATTGRSGQTQLNIEYIANFDLIKTDSKRIELSQPMFVVAFKHPQQFIFFKLQYSI